MPVRTRGSTAPRTPAARRRRRPAASRRRRGPASGSSPRRRRSATAGSSWFSATSAAVALEVSYPARPPTAARSAGTRTRSARPALSASTARNAGMPAADVVEHAVEQHPQPALVRRGDQRVEVAVVAEPRVDPEVVDGVVAVRLGREHRAEREPGGAQLDGVVQPAVSRPSRCTAGPVGRARPARRRRTPAGRRATRSRAAPIRTRDAAPSPVLLTTRRNHIRTPHTHPGRTPRAGGWAGGGPVGWFLTNEALTAEYPDSPRPAPMMHRCGGWRCVEAARVQRLGLGWLPDRARGRIVAGLEGSSRASGHVAFRLRRSLTSAGPIGPARRPRCPTPPGDSGCRAAGIAADHRYFAGVSP